MPVRDGRPTDYSDSLSEAFGDWPSVAGQDRATFKYALPLCRQLKPIHIATKEISDLPLNRAVRPICHLQSQIQALEKNAVFKPFTRPESTLSVRCISSSVEKSPDLVVARQTVNPALNQNQMILPVNVMPRLLQMLPEIHRFLDQIEKLLRQIKSNTACLQNSKDFVPSDLRRTDTLLRITHDQLNRLFRRGQWRRPMQERRRKPSTPQRF